MQNSTSDHESTPEGEIEPPPPSQDYSLGYSLLMSVYPDGFAVSGPVPLADDPDAEPNAERIPDLRAAIHALLALHKAHPVGEDAQGAFTAGYEA